MSEGEREFRERILDEVILEARRRLLSRGLSADELMDEYLAKADRFSPRQKAVWLLAIKPAVYGTRRGRYSEAQARAVAGAGTSA